MQPRVKKRLLRIAVLSLIAFVIGAGMGLYQVNQQAGSVIKPPQNMRLNGAVAGMDVGGPFTLTSHGVMHNRTKRFRGVIPVDIIC